MWQRVLLCMSRNKRKKAQSYLETCLVRVSLRSVFRKPPDNICWWFWSHFETHFGANLTLEGPWEGPWDHPGTPLDPDLKKVPKIIKKIPFLDLILETFFHQIFCIFHCSFKLRFGEPSEPLFKGFGGHFESISELVFPTFWRDWKPWKMQPLQCETTVFKSPEAGIFINFPCIFQDKF